MNIHKSDTLFSLAGGLPFSKSTGKDPTDGVGERYEDHYLRQANDRQRVA